MAAITSCSAVDLRRVRVTFDFEPPAVDPGATTDATNPANWTFVGQAPGPTAEVAPLSVTSVTGTTLEIVTDRDLSPGKEYQIAGKTQAAGGITGLTGVAELVFTAFMPDQPADRDFAIAGFIPEKNWREDYSGDLAKFAAVLQDVLTVLLATVDRWTDILDPDTCDEQFVDAMLGELGFPFGEAPFDFSLSERRRFVGLLVDVFKQKGTGVGVINAIRLFVGLESTILVQNVGGWMLGIDNVGVGSVLSSKTAAYRFEVRVGTPGGSALTALEDTQIRAVIAFMKPCNTLLTRVTAALPPPQYVGATPGLGAVTVAWAAVAGATSYRVYSRDRPDVSPYNGAAHQVMAGASWLDTPVPAGAQRFYIVAAVAGSNPDGTGGTEGAVSREVAAQAL